MLLIAWMDTMKVSQIILAQIVMHYVKHVKHHLAIAHLATLEPTYLAILAYWIV